MNFFRWGFRANIKLHQSDDEHSVAISPRGEKFSEFVRSLDIINPNRKLILNPLLFNGTLQTLYYTSKDTSKQFLVYYGREIFRYSDGGSCSLDWVIPREDREVFKQKYERTLPENSPRLHPRTRFLEEGELKDRDTPIVVVVHGLAGGSHEPLIRNLAENVQKKTPDWDVVVINSRGCCRTKITSGKLFSAFSTDDIKEVLIDLKKRNSKRPIYAVGFSFGAALLLNYLSGMKKAEDKMTELEKSQDKAEDEVAPSDLIEASCLIGCPWDFVDSAYHLQSSWSGSYLFSPALCTFLNKLIQNNLPDLSKYDSVLFNDENMAKSKKARMMMDVDNTFTCKLVGYPNAIQYYRDASPVNTIYKIKTPTLIVNLNDDPTISGRLPAAEVLSNPYLALVETDLGGHLGYVKPNGEFWGVAVVEDFFREFEKTRHE